MHVAYLDPYSILNCTGFCAVTNKTYSRIYAVVRRIPRGRVATYGQVAELAGLEGRARQVGYALHVAPSGLPWHRVINARGEISARKGSDWGELQRHLLEAEGIEFDADDRIDLKKFQISNFK
jgi:methylated-DNA-protein-cysteine methyltransferase related protein